MKKMKKINKKNKEDESSQLHHPFNTKKEKLTVGAVYGRERKKRKMTNQEYLDRQLKRLEKYKRTSKPQKTSKILIGIIIFQILFGLFVLACILAYAFFGVSNIFYWT